MEITYPTKKSDWRHLEFVVPIKQQVTEDKDEFLITGVAINSTVTKNGTKFVAEELRMAAGTLRNKPLLKDHNNSVDSIVGRTTENVKFSVDKILFEASVVDRDMQSKIRARLIQNVSVGAFVKDLEFEEGEEDDVNGVVIARGIEFVELSLVAVPADPDAGFAAALSECWNKKKELQSGSTTTTSSVTLSNTDAYDRGEIKMSEEKKENKKVEEKSDDLKDAIKSLTETVAEVKSGLEELKQNAEEKEEPKEEPAKEEPKEEPKKEDAALKQVVETMKVVAEEVKNIKKEQVELKNSTKGKVQKQVSEEAMQTLQEAYSGYHIGEDTDVDAGVKGDAIWRENYFDDKFKRLNPDKGFYPN